jgi:hypothetical protein
MKWWKGDGGRAGPTVCPVSLNPRAVVAIVLVYAVTSDALSRTSPLVDAVETFLRREDSERFIDEVRGDDPDLASYLRIEEREMEASGLN